MTAVEAPASTDERALLAASVADYTERAGGVARMRRLRGSAAEYDRGEWRTIAQLGWLAIPVPEACGGLALGLREAAIVAEGLGRVLAPEPYVAVLLALDALLGGDNESLKQERAAQIMEGSTLPVLAWQEAAGDVVGHTTRTTAAPCRSGWRVSGMKRYIAGATGADAFIVSAQSAEGPILAWIERQAEGVALALDPIADGRHLGTLTLDGAQVASRHIVASAATAQAALDRALDRAMAMCSAELLGVMTHALDMGLEYLRTRVQFGKPIGSFQALQHRAVDLLIQRSLTAAVLDETVGALDREVDARSRALAASRAKARSAEAGARITRELIQFHGAIGFTDELDAGLYLKRALVLETWLGGAAWHRRRYAALSLAGAA